MLLLGLLPKKQNSTSFILEAKSIQLEESTNCKHVKLLKTKKRNGNYFDRCPFQSLRDKNLQNTSTLSIALMADVGQLRTEGFNRVKTAAVNKLHYAVGKMVLLEPKMFLDHARKSGSPCTA